MGSKDRVKHETKKPKKAKKPAPVTAPTITLTEHGHRKPGPTENHPPTP